MSIPREFKVEGKSGKHVLKQVLKEALPSALRCRDFFNRRFMEHLFDEHRRGVRDWGFHLWMLLNRSLRYDRWIERG